MSSGGTTVPIRCSTVIRPIRTTRVGDAKAYQYEMTDAEHVQLYEVLSLVRGKVAIPSYHCALMDRL